MADLLALQPNMDIKLRIVARRLPRPWIEDLRRALMPSMGEGGG
jgi:hypothetical protein